MSLLEVLQWLRKYRFAEIFHIFSLYLIKMKFTHLKIFVKTYPVLNYDSCIIAIKFRHISGLTC